MNYQEIEGDLIKLAKEGKFDVIAHGCNCFCKMSRGIAPQMVKAFDVQNEAQYYLESDKYIGDIGKLGNIQIGVAIPAIKSPNGYLKVINAYTQYNWDTQTKPFDYEAFIICMRKINHIFKEKHIGLPMIGSHLAGGDWEIIKQIIQKELKDCQVTVVIYKS